MDNRKQLSNLFIVIHKVTKYFWGKYMQSIIKYIAITVFCFFFVMVKPTNAQYKPLDISFLDEDGLLKYPSITIDDTPLLPKSISSLLILILDKSETALVEKPKLKLIGKNNQEQYFDLGDLRFDHLLRIDEAVAFFEKKNRLHIGSRLRGMFLFWNEYSWNGKQAIWLRTNQENPRDEYLTSLPIAAKNYLAQGKIDKAIETISKTKKKRSPQLLGLECLKYSNEIAKKMQRVGKTAKACKLMEEIFDLESNEIAIPRFEEIKNISDYEQAIVSDINNYSLTFYGYLEIVAHYAVLLQQTRQLDKSIEILKQLIAIAPDNASFHLYLADSFWLSDNKSEAVILYNSYISKAKSDFSNNKIAKRALYRTETNNQH